MKQMKCWVPGEPKGQPRPRAFTRVVGARHVARVYNPADAEAWKGSIAAHAGVCHEPITGPVALAVQLYFARPKRLCRKSDSPLPIMHTSKPDCDNVIKALLDTLTRLGWWRDDAQVCELSVSKFYQAKDRAPGAQIELREIAT